MILQDLAMEKLDWNIEVSNTYVKEWKDWLVLIECLRDIN